MSSSIMQGKRVLITGGNSGIGKHTAIGLARLGAEVIITSRDANRGQAAAEEIRGAAPGAEVGVRALDLASFDSIRAFARGFVADFDRLDVLINNAGLILDTRQTTAEGLEMTFGVNHMGHFVLTHELLELLERSAPARVVNVASDAHKGARKGLSFDDLGREQGYSSFQAYAESKLANILFSNELARRVEGRGITSNALHPGAIRSGFGMDGDLGGVGAWIYRLMRPFMKGPQAGAQTSIHCASAPELAQVSGEYFANRRPAKTTRWARDSAAAARLWALSEAWMKSPPGAD